MYDYLTDKFGEFYIYDNLSTYGYMSVFVKPDDEKFIIYGVAGTMDHVNNIDECYKQMTEISNEFKTLFFDSKISETTYNHLVDKSGKSKTKEIMFKLKNGDYARIMCMDFEENLRIENNWTDGLSVLLETKELGDWFLKR